MLLCIWHQPEPTEASAGAGGLMNYDWLQTRLKSLTLSRADFASQDSFGFTARFL